jgi:hypothetical protein
LQIFHTELDRAANSVINSPGKCWKGVGKKKRHTLKSQVVVDKRTKKVTCTTFSNGKKHDFKLFKESKVRWMKERSGVTDSRYTGIKKLQKNSRLPKKSSKKKTIWFTFQPHCRNP